ncbi:hypothetical protein KP79_PYT12102 [Mizuhopecten yessoensis]|uniref:Uncharacterized protein n=1 Tax=Mizuhopecten yessoensis TaxID=6573 RepID=A0A210QBK6_MIZYE|nr:hypothetical protein KP79_PYT12102 [Mizuhopecten yessoensis]
MPLFPTSKWESISSEDEESKHLSWTQRIKKGPTKKRKKKEKSKRDKPREDNDEQTKLKNESKDPLKTQRNRLASIIKFKEKDVFESEKMKLIDGRPRPQLRTSPQKVWESKTPFVFTHGTFPPIAEAEETSLVGDQVRHVHRKVNAHFITMVITSPLTAQIRWQVNRIFDELEKVYYFE